MAIDSNHINAYVEKTMELARAEFEKTGHNIAKDIEKNYLEPFCLKWNLSYASGMGVYSFVEKTLRNDVDFDECSSVRGDLDHGLTDDDIWDHGVPIYHDKEFYEEFKAITEVLNFCFTISSLNQTHFYTDDVN